MVQGQGLLLLSRPSDHMPLPLYQESMTPEEKLQRIRDLMEIEQNIKAELLGLISGEAEVEEAEEPKPQPQKRAYKKRAKAKKVKSVARQPKERPAQTKVCPECGSPS